MALHRSFRGANENTVEGIMMCNIFDYTMICNKYYYVIYN